MKSTARRKQAALELLKKQDFLYQLGSKLEDIGLIGERRNSLILFLSCITSAFADPVSVIVKGVTSSGKSNLIKTVLRLFLNRFIISRTSLSGKAPVHSKKEVAHRILYLAEFRGGKDAQYLIRLQQSEGEIAHEYATLTSRSRGTNIVRKRGTPVVITSTTESAVFADDETRFLSLWVNESPEQTLAIVKAELAPPINSNAKDLIVWQTATEMLLSSAHRFEFPKWFESVADQLPVNHVRVRRDWRRFLSLCQAVALCRSWADASGRRGRPNQITISFPDYCVSYHLLNSAFASSVYNAHEREVQIAQFLRRIYAKECKPLSVSQISKGLGWETALVYKFVKRAVSHHLISQEKGTREHNLKRYVPISTSKTQFLPTPQSVLNRHDELGEKVTYVHPMKGTTVMLEKS